MKYIIYMVVIKETLEIIHFAYSKFDIDRCRQTFINTLNSTPNKTKQQHINNYILPIGGADKIKVLQYLELDTNKEYLNDVTNYMKHNYVKTHVLFKE